MEIFTFVSSAIIALASIYFFYRVFASVLETKEGRFCVLNLAAGSAAFLCFSLLKEFTK